MTLFQTMRVSIRTWQWLRRSHCIGSYWFLSSHGALSPSWKKQIHFQFPSLPYESITTQKTQAHLAHAKKKKKHTHIATEQKNQHQIRTPPPSLWFLASSGLLWGEIINWDKPAFPPHRSMTRAWNHCPFPPPLTQGGGHSKPPDSTSRTWKSSYSYP